MIVLVTGGAASGKSAYAERLALALPGPHAYVATMRHGDEETEARIARHREMRAGKGFVTLELADGGLPEEGSCLARAAGVERPERQMQADRSLASDGGLPEEGSCLARAAGAERPERQTQADRSSLSARQLRNSSPSATQTVLAPAAPSLVAACGRRSGHPAPACNPGTALLEDLGNLVANGLEGKLGDVLAFENVVIVANEVGCDGIQYDAFTMNYIETLGRMACELAACADVVVEVIAGVPNVVKGEVSWAC